MAQRIRLILFVLLFPTVLSAEVGMSYFAIQHPRFPCREALRVFHGVKHPTLAILWGTFGRDNDCLAAWFRQTRNKPRTLEIHLTNEACVRNRRCHAGEIKGSRRELQNRVLSILKTVEPFRNNRTRLLLSTGLEDNYSRHEFQRRLKIIRGVWPYEIVRNPLYGEHRGAADLLERHGLHSKTTAPCFTNMDGVSLHTGVRRSDYSPSVSVGAVREFLRRRQSCELFFLWTASSQGLYGGKDFTNPRDRTFSVTPRDIRYLNELMR